MALQADYMLSGGTVITVDGERRIFRDGAVAFRGSDIVAVGKRDLIELNGRSHLSWPKPPGIRFNKYIESDCPTVFADACKLGLEGTCRSARTRPTFQDARPTGSK